MTILVVDDDLFALKLLGSQIEKIDRAPVVLIEQAQAAVTLLEADGESVDLIFCDLQMPDIDGVEFVRHLARIGWHGSLVLVSGEDARVRATAEKLARAHGIHLLDGVGKPVPLQRLRELLSRHESRKVERTRAAAAPCSPDALRAALADGQLVNHYQPKVSLSSGELVGVEALVRWQHPELGLIHPDRFIGVAEEHDLIDALTGIVLDSALRQVRAWSDAGLATQVSVNVSMDNLGDLDFPDKVERAARVAGAPLSSLVLEVTESRLMKNTTATLDILARMRLKRIGLSIDDFGTGHSSLAQLRDLPFDELKLDRGFVSGAVRGGSLAAIVEGTLAMARQLGITSVGEGVEDRDDWDFLQARGCDVAQGYFIARPMPPWELPAWLAAWKLRQGALTPRPA